MACNLAPGDPALFVRERIVPVDDPIMALAWVQSEDEVAARKSPAKEQPFGTDPAAAIALDNVEIDWLDGFLTSKHVPVDTASLIGPCHSHVRIGFP